MAGKKRQRLTGGNGKLDRSLKGLVKSRTRSIAIRKRRQAIRKMLLQGVRDQRDMAARLNCSQPTVSNDIKFIFNEWLDQDIKETKAEIAYRVRQLELGAFEAYQAFQRSKQNDEQVKTSYDREVCPQCGGKKTINGSKKLCEVCKGIGEIVVENITRSVRGQAGDAGLLRIYTDSIKEAAKLKGLYVKKKEISKEVVHVHTGVNWDNIPDDQLLKVRQAFTNVLASPAVDVNSELVSEGELDD